MLPLGAPTNAVDGAQAAASVTTVEDWRALTTRRLWLEQTGNVDDPELTAALAGHGAVLPALPRPADREPWTGRWCGRCGRRCGGTCCATCGGSARTRTGSAPGPADHLAPEGPLPPVRIGDQAYGLLPTSGMSRWRTPAAGGPRAACAERIAAAAAGAAGPGRDAAPGAAGRRSARDTATLLD